MKRITFIAATLMSLVLAVSFSPAQNAPQEKTGRARAPRRGRSDSSTSWRGNPSAIRRFPPTGSGSDTDCLPRKGTAKSSFASRKGRRNTNSPPVESRTGQIAFSEDGKFAAFMTYPTAKDSKALRKDRKPVYTKAIVLNSRPATRPNTTRSAISRFPAKMPPGSP